MSARPHPPSLPSPPVSGLLSAILSDPHVPEDRRFCGGCGAPVGRSRPGHIGRSTGYCGGCGVRFSFVPKLGSGDLVAGQYEVAGCLARGGLGWIYLARDRNVHDRWVVLKGLLNSGDADALAAAAAERRFLAEIDHPGVVRVLNVVRHGDAVYTVLEHVGGRSLRELTLERRRATGASPPLRQIIGWALQVLATLGDLHDRGLLYCDFKPANAIMTGDRLRLIDLGGMRRADDDDSPVYGTVGFQAPEVEEAGPSVRSDLYTVARTMAVLAFEFPGFSGRYRYLLPERDRVPVLARHESFDLLLRRATHPDPGLRFGSAAEMAEQLDAVRREVLAAEDGVPRPAASARFGPEPHPPGIGSLQPPPAAALAKGLPAALGAGGGWREEWERGVQELRDGRPARAAERFAQVRATLPGEAAPQLALAYCAELRDDPAAERHYERVWTTGRDHFGAVFGLARTRTARADRDGAVRALDTVPAGSAHQRDAQITAILVRLRHRDPRHVGLADLQDADRRLSALDLPSRLRGRLAILLLETALGHLRERNVAPPAAARLLGRKLIEPDLRRGLEWWHRELAGRAGTRGERLRLIERANALRPRTLL
ncbi:tetratricopeptide repeat protein [Actinomadura hibisca]|uniref:tetratricopeptide repeat protein n=1 Tax=Actinomadura hibisca TaxID=68565 RepID=UPI0008329BDC|nr:tetratricopeptide repeat protein [Actinomadura hibisca]